MGCPIGNFKDLVVLIDIFLSLLNITYWKIDKEKKKQKVPLIQCLQNYNITSLNTHSSGINSNYIKTSNNNNNNNNNNNK